MPCGLHLCDLPGLAGAPWLVVPCSSASLVWPGGLPACPCPIPFPGDATLEAAHAGTPISAAVDARSKVLRAVITCLLGAATSFAGCVVCGFIPSTPLKTQLEAESQGLFAARARRGRFGGGFVGCGSVGSRFVGSRFRVRLFGAPVGGGGVRVRFCRLRRFRRLRMPRRRRRLCAL